MSLHRPRSRDADYSPPHAGYPGRAVKRKSAGADVAHHASYAYPLHPSQLHERGLPSLPTPQLSSGPSSNDSSSRPPSPSLRGHPTAPHHGREHGTLPSAHHHHHLAHSVRLAFGMTPIHAAPRNTSWPFSQPHSGVSTPLHFGAGAGASTSMPGSRSGSPPITLPPLKLAAAGCSMEEEDATAEAERGRVELPGFSLFEAAARAPPLDGRMAVDVSRT